MSCRFIKQIRNVKAGRQEVRKGRTEGGEMEEVRKGEREKGRKKGRKGGREEGRKGGTEE